MRSIGAAFVAGLVCLALLASGDTAQAGVGKLDASFAKNGLFFGLPEGNGMLQSDVAYGPDGSTLIAEGLRLTRLLPDGRHDRRFGRSGTRELQEALRGLDFELRRAVIDQEGRVLGFGSAVDPTRVYSLLAPGTPSVAVGWAVVFRLRPDGSLDPTFGGGSGYVRTDFGLPGELPYGRVLTTDIPPVTDRPLARALTGVVDSRGRPILVVGTSELYSQCYGSKSSYGWSPRAVIRLTSSGGLDSGFGGGDGVSPVAMMYPGAPPKLVLGERDRLLLAGDLGEVCDQGTMVARFGSDGIPPAGLGENGISLFSPNLMLAALGPKGEMVFWREEPTPRLVRFDADGTRDSGFGRSGFAPVPTLRDAEAPGAVAVDRRGRLLIASSFTPPKGKDWGPGKTPRSILALARLGTNGKLDRSFGRRGWILTPFNRDVGPTGLALDAQGRARVVAWATRPPRPGVRPVLARYVLGG